MQSRLIEFINAYYSASIIIFSILCTIKENQLMNLLNIFLSILLLIFILYFNNQQFYDRANKFRDNYTSLQNLEFRLMHLDDNCTDEIRKIEDEYCSLLRSVENHISYDYVVTLHYSNYEYRLKKLGKKSYINSIKFYFGYIWRRTIAGILFLVPIIILFSWLYKWG